ncbi:hypothetical protein [Nonomuraea dietziae]|uniref:hypothetical protein n=1 Tax=Nonomuraea dietziae TaxID=65515 RepID=UPI0031D752BF
MPSGRLDAAGLPSALTPIGGDSRTTLVVHSGTTALFNEPGPEVTPAELDRFLADFLRAGEARRGRRVSGTAAESVPSDSTPPSPTCPRSPTIVDADGEPLRHAPKGRPTIVKPNRTSWLAPSPRAARRRSSPGARARSWSPWARTACTPSPEGRFRARMRTGSRATHDRRGRRAGGGARAAWPTARPAERRCAGAARGAAAVAAHGGGRVRPRRVRRHPPADRHRLRSTMPLVRHRRDRSTTRRQESAAFNCDPAASTPPPIVAGAEAAGVRPWCSDQRERRPATTAPSSPSRWPRSPGQARGAARGRPPRHTTHRQGAGRGGRLVWASASVMFDASTRCRRGERRGHGRGRRPLPRARVWVEAELGEVGGKGRRARPGGPHQAARGRRLRRPHRVDALASPSHSHA